MASHKFERALSERAATGTAQSMRPGNKPHKPQRCRRALRDLNEGSIKVDLDNKEGFCLVSYAGKAGHYFGYSPNKNTALSF